MKIHIKKREIETAQSQFVAFPNVPHLLKAKAPKTESGYFTTHTVQIFTLAGVAGYRITDGGINSNDFSFS